jgi:hypothetical protein
MMHWTGYTVFSVISGVLLVIMCLLPGVKAGSRILYLLGGVALAGYGVFVAKQTSGTYYFSIYIFIIPVVAVIEFVRQLSGTQSRKTPFAAAQRATSYNAAQGGQTGFGSAADPGAPSANPVQAAPSPTLSLSAPPPRAPTAPVIGIAQTWSERPSPAPKIVIDSSDLGSD